MNSKPNLIFTDLQLFRIIQKVHEKDYYEFLNNDTKDDARFYFPLNFQEISSELNTYDEVIFNRLLFYLEKKYGYKQEDNSSVHLFAYKIGRKSNCINYPYLCAILAELEEKERKYSWNFKLSLTAIIISIVSLMINYYY